ncbi:GtrA family protein [Aurantimonas endophytica]|uniref:GtrA family protein n=1 Tax=Aurantimonas endophytica TaxID=1522175 RepID=UPI001606DBCE|nr:hypothetical protein [Aurantimonas endophytica]
MRIRQALADGRLWTFIKFCIVGGLSALLWLSASTYLLAATQMSATAINIISYSICIPFNFLLHRIFTYHSFAPVVAQFFKYIVAHTFNIVFSSICILLIELFVDHVGLHHMVFVIAITTVSQFIILSKLVYSRERGLQ